MLFHENVFNRHKVSPDLVYFDYRLLNFLNVKLLKHPTNKRLLKIYLYHVSILFYKNVTIVYS